VTHVREEFRLRLSGGLRTVSRDSEFYLLSAQDLQRARDRTEFVPALEMCNIPLQFPRRELMRRRREVSQWSHQPKTADDKNGEQDYAGDTCGKHEPPEKPFGFGKHPIERLHDLDDPVHRVRRIR
jgi:hypothetical protein